jgi:Fe-S oxidoreductase
MKVASMIPFAYGALKPIIKTIAGFASGRSLPDVTSNTWKKWYLNKFKIQKTGKIVYIFIDELLNFNEPQIGIASVKLLDKLGYEVRFVEHASSGRSFLSKGLLEDARKLAQKNIQVFKDIITPGTPLVGVEPSAILSFRDEYPDLVRGEEKVSAQKIGASTFMIEEFLAKELDAGRIDPKMFKEQKKVIKLHGHCQQKALSSLTPVKKILTRLGNNEVHLIPSGCCGMAGSFGYEKEHFDLSMQIGELVLFPTVRKQPADVVIAAAGVSCRHQIKDGTGRRSLHPVEILLSSLS